MTLGRLGGRANFGSISTGHGFSSIESLSSVRPLESFRNIGGLGAFVCLSHHLLIGWGVGFSSGVPKGKCPLTLGNIGSHDNFESIRTADGFCSIGSLSSVKPLESFRNIRGISAVPSVFHVK